MAAIGWSQMMSVGVPVLDADHKTLVGLINNLHRAIGDDEEYATLGSVLQALEEYAAHHFAREEQVMAACRYPSLQAHMGMHQRLTAQVAALRAAYDADRSAVRARQCLDFLNKWLIEHICSVDMDYRASVVGHGGLISAVDTTALAGRAGSASLDWKSLKILVVDDNQNFCEIMRTILEGVGVADIRIAGDVETAQAVLSGKSVDMLVTDWHVGKESGLDLVAWVRRQPALETLPVLILSGHEQISNRDVALNAGADEFMEKPISARGLLICLAKLMRKGREA